MGHFLKTNLLGQISNGVPPVQQFPLIDTTNFRLSGHYTFQAGFNHFGVHVLVSFWVSGAT